MDQAPAVAMSDASRRMIVLATMSALFLAALDQTIVVTAVPRIIAELSGLALLPWVTTSYLLTSTTVLPLAGKAGDRFGRRSVFLLAIAIFVVGSLAAGAAQTMLQLVVFRAVQGAGGGMLMATAFAVIGDVYSPRDRGRIQGGLAAMFGLASVIGPIAGGLITDMASWRWVFYVNVPVAAVAATLIAVSMPRLPRSDRPRPPLDLAGAAALASALVPLLLALTWAGDRFEWASPAIGGLFALAATMTGVFVWVERRAPDPILPLSLARNRTFAVTGVAGFMVGFGMFSVFTLVPLFLQGVNGVSASEAGRLLTPLTLAIVGSSALAGQIVSRTGRYKLLILAGIGAMAGGLAVLGTVDGDTSRSEVVRNVMLAGAGLGVTLPTFTVVVQNALPPQLMGVSTASVQFFRSVGGVTGVAVTTSLMLSRFRAGIVGSAADVPAITGDPNKLLNEGTLDELRVSYEAGTAGGVPFEVALAAARAALADAIGSVFLIAAVVVTIGFVATLLLPELALRGGSPAEWRRQAAAEASASEAVGSEAAGGDVGTPAHGGESHG